MTLPDNIIESLNAGRGGFNEAMGITFVSATLDEVVGELTLERKHHQPYGITHGGVYCSMIETLCSVGAALNTMPDGKTTVGLENNTSFLRAARAGKLRCTAKPLVKGRRTHVWQATVHDSEDRLCATGRVRMIVLEPGARAAGKKLGLEGS